MKWGVSELCSKPKFQRQKKKNPKQSKLQGPL